MSASLLKKLLVIFFTTGSAFAQRFDWQVTEYTAVDASNFTCAGNIAAYFSGPASGGCITTAASPARCLSGINFDRHHCLLKIYSSEDCSGEETTYPVYMTFDDHRRGDFPLTPQDTGLPATRSALVSCLWDQGSGGKRARQQRFRSDI